MNSPHLHILPLLIFDQQERNVNLLSLGIVEGVGHIYISLHQMKKQLICGLLHFVELFGSKLLIELSSPNFRVNRMKSKGYALGSPP
jgi:hypothetical protein